MGDGSGPRVDLLTPSQGWIERMRECHAVHCASESVSTALEWCKFKGPRALRRPSRSTQTVVCVALTESVHTTPCPVRRFSNTCPIPAQVLLSPLFALGGCCSGWCMHHTCRACRSCQQQAAAACSHVSFHLFTGACCCIKSGTQAGAPLHLLHRRGTKRGIAHSKLW